MTTLSLPDSLRRARPALDLPAGIRLVRGRVHDLCGPARRRFALWLAARMAGPVLWIAPAWGAERLNPDGMRPLLDPGRILFVHPRRAVDLLWCAEEALRAGAVPVVVADLPEPPALTPVRRLHLAAETSGAAPLGLLLTPGDGGARGVESRWHMAPAHRGQAWQWQLERRRARMQPPRRWQVHLSNEADAGWIPAPDGSPVGRSPG